MEHEIICPHCKQVFTIDEAKYAEIVDQVRTNEFNREIASRIHDIEENHKKDLEIARRDTAADFTDKIHARDQEISELSARLDNAETAKKLAVTEAVAELTRERDQIRSELASAAALSSSREMMLKQNYEQQIRDREETIDRLKEMKSKMSTKMVGESLEQHCQNEFNSIRATAFPRA